MTSRLYRKMVRCRPWLEWSLIGAGIGLFLVASFGQFFFQCYLKLMSLLPRSLIIFSLPSSQPVWVFMIGSFAAVLCGCAVAVALRFILRNRNDRRAPLKN